MKKCSSLTILLSRKNDYATIFFEAYSPIAKDPSNIIEIILKVSSIAKEIVLSL